MGKDGRVEIFIRQLKKLFGKRLRKIILFGSRARGNNKQDSDYDFLVIFDEVTPEIRERIYDLVAEILFKYSVVFSAFLFTEESLYKKRYSPFIINAQKEGVVL